MVLASQSPNQAPRIQYGNSFISVELLAWRIRWKSFWFPDCLRMMALIEHALYKGCLVRMGFLVAVPQVATMPVRLSSSYNTSMVPTEPLRNKEHAQLSIIISFNIFTFHKNTSEVTSKRDVYYSFKSNKGLALPETVQEFKLKWIKIWKRSDSFLI